MTIMILTTEKTSQTKHIFKRRAAAKKSHQKHSKQHLLNRNHHQDPKVVSDCHHPEIVERDRVARQVLESLAEQVVMKFEEKVASHREGAIPGRGQEVNQEQDPWKRTPIHCH
jgi:hypothetical protein